MKENILFPELISTHIREIMETRKRRYGAEDSGYRALYYQYIQTEDEISNTREHNKKHYEACVESATALRYVERLYKRQATVDLTSACSAHCRYCLRQNYTPWNISETDMEEIVSYISADPYLKEILITGGDPLLVSGQLIVLIEMLIHRAPNIKIIRIGSRLPVQSPEKLSEDILNCFRKNSGKVCFEIGIQVNHVIELQSETIECLKHIRENNVCIYSQNVLLRNVNDTLETLTELYDKLRYLNIESHYLFHPVPIARTAHFRNSLTEFLSLARQLTSSGEIPGRSKPMFSLMTDVGKCTLYEGTVREKDPDGYYDIFTGYRLEERQKWRKGYRLPASAHADRNGFIHVKYLDGGDKNG